MFALGARSLDIHNEAATLFSPEQTMPNDNKNNPPKPNTNKDQKITDLPNNKAGQKDQDVKGGRMKQEIDSENL